MEALALWEQRLRGFGSGSLEEGLSNQTWKGPAREGGLEEECPR